MSRTPLLGALAVVLNNGHVLLAQRSKSPGAGLWGFPGGHVEWGETALQAAVRELREETGIEAEARAYITNIDLVRHRPDGAVELHYLLAAVLCAPLGGVLRAGDDAAAVRWVPFADVTGYRLEMSPGVNDVLALARALTG